MLAFCRKWSIPNLLGAAWMMGERERLMTYDFAGRTVLISGAGRGLGEAAALHFSRSGATVAVCDRDAGLAQAVTRSIVSEGGKAISYAGDMSRRDTCFEIAERFAAEAGPIDIVINNASVLIYEAVEDITEESLDAAIDGGLKTVFWGTQAFLAHRNAQREGNIINFSSPVVYRGFPRSAAYSAVKGAVASLTKVLAAELGPRGIRVNAIAPGSIPTPGATAYVSDAEYERRAAAIPLRRLGEPADIAKAIAFIIGPDAGFINGAMLSVDGGIIAA